MQKKEKKIHEIFITENFNQQNKYMSVFLPFSKKVCYYRKSIEIAESLA